jgi:hypothetical protein
MRSLLVYAELQTRGIRLRKIYFGSARRHRFTRVVCRTYEAYSNSDMTFEAQNRTIFIVWDSGESWNQDGTVCLHLNQGSFRF